MMEDITGISFIIIYWCNRLEHYLDDIVLLCLRTVQQVVITTFLVGEAGQMVGHGGEGSSRARTPLTNRAACLFGCRPLRRVPNILYSLLDRCRRRYCRRLLRRCASRAKTVSLGGQRYHITVQLNRRASTGSRDQWVVRGGPGNRRSTAPAYRAFDDFVVLACVAVVIIILFSVDSEYYCRVVRYRARVSVVCRAPPASTGTETPAGSST